MQIRNVVGTGGGTGVRWLPGPRAVTGDARRPPVAVVTGAARGVGRAVAGRLAAEGHRLVLADVDGPGLRRTAAAFGPRHLALELDVSHADASQELAAAARHRFGRLDVWVNNAGVVPLGRLDEQPADLLARTWEVNVGGVVHGSRAALRVMRAQGHGHIVNISSVLAVKPLAGFALYSATKAGVAALSESLRREARGDGVHVTSVLPYMVDTAAAAGIQPHLLPALRPEQVADAVAAGLRRPRAQVFVPRAARLLTVAVLLPQWARDTLDTVLGLDGIAQRADTVARAAYEAELRTSDTPS